MKKFFLLGLLFLLIMGGEAISGSEIGDKSILLQDSGTMILVGGGLIGLAGYGRKWMKK